MRLFLLHCTSPVMTAAFSHNQDPTATLTAGFAVMHKAALSILG
jgi:hypothetical protein